MGDELAQGKCLLELLCVLHASSAGRFLAMFNYWMTVAHCKRAFLSLLPYAWTTPDLRTMRDYSVYRCKRLQILRLKRVVIDTEFHYRDCFNTAIFAMSKIEFTPSIDSLILQRSSDEALQTPIGIMPTTICRFHEECVQSRVFLLPAIMALS